MSHRYALSGGHALLNNLSGMSSIARWLHRLTRLRALAFDLHAAPISAEEPGTALQRWAGGFPMGLCGLSHLTELDISLRAFDRPAIVLPEV